MIVNLKTVVSKIPPPFALDHKTNQQLIGFVITVRQMGLVKGSYESANIPFLASRKALKTRLLALMNHTDLSRLIL